MVLLCTKTLTSRKTFTPCEGSEPAETVISLIHMYFYFQYTIYTYTQYIDTNSSYIAWNGTAFFKIQLIYTSLLAKLQYYMQPRTAATTTSYTIVVRTQQYSASTMVVIWECTRAMFIRRVCLLEVHILILYY